MIRDRQMRRGRAAALCVTVAAAMSISVLAGCGSGGDEGPAVAQPATVESIPGSPAVRVRLTADAAKRIGLQTRLIKRQVVPAQAQLTAYQRRATATSGRAVKAVLAALAATSGDTEPPTSASGPKPGATATTAPPTTTTTTTAPPVPRLTAPAAAILYRPMGDGFVYVVVGPLLYERQPVIVDYIVSDLAVLVSGPPDGTPVVTFGAAELLGAELGVGGGELG